MRPVSSPGLKLFGTWAPQKNFYRVKDFFIFMQKNFKAGRRSKWQIFAKKCIKMKIVGFLVYLVGCLVLLTSV